MDAGLEPYACSREQREARIPLLLHACCGPCSLEPILALRDKGYEPHVLWTNPNIQPIEEHDKRHDTLAAWLSNPFVDIELIEGACDREAWERVVAPHLYDRVPRCRACYALRIAETCRVAKELGYTHVSTTLAVSPYQLFDDCKEILERIAAANGLVAVIDDWRDRYPEATRCSVEMGMYRQRYCGCRFSAVEAQRERKERNRARKKARAARRAAERTASQQEENQNG
ncbi:MAG: epoxyqueuosine reductase QueH [Atopobiaceae bacterium]|nr:epoxyqueuosine reductase QueH [Atopobiaceae bacterium]